MLGTQYDIFYETTFDEIERTGESMVRLILELNKLENENK